MQDNSSPFALDGPRGTQTFRPKIKQLKLILTITYNPYLACERNKLLATANGSVLRVLQPQMEL